MEAKKTHLADFVQSFLVDLLPRTRACRCPFGLMLVLGSNQESLVGKETFMSGSKRFTGIRSGFVLVIVLSNCALCLGVSPVEIRIRNSNPAIAYAGAELGKYTDLMAAGSAKGVIELGLFEDCGVKQVPALQDRALDDAIVVDVKNGSGFIAGSNPRSVLQGVYRFLGELGCRWVRPGASGEIIPGVETEKMTVALDETASYRNRIICIEGAASVTNCIDIIDWMAKVGFNGFQMQFRDGYTFFDRWYSHEDNPELQRKEPIGREVAQEFTGLIERELGKRGLLYHAVGHGWHAEAFGVPAVGWMPNYNLPRDFLNHMALVKGQRTVNWERPTLTALCYSDPYVQKKMVDCIADYAQAHPNVDYLHVWLEDGDNSKCECDVCRQKRPADFYIQILNRLDQELKARKLDTRIVFIGYSDLLWTPLHERLKDNTRFTFLYANSRHDYSRALNPADKSVPPLPFRLNQMQPGCSDNEYVVSFLNDWERFFPGDRMIFEYYGGPRPLKWQRSSGRMSAT
jgi:hypothetical protein